MLTPGFGILHIFVFSGGIEYSNPLFLIKHIGGGWGGGGGKGSVYPEGDMLRSLVLTCLVLFSLFESEDSRFAFSLQHLPLQCSFKAAQVLVSSDNVALLLRGDEYFRRDFTL